jgi:hypothetical protein
MKNTLYAAVAACMAMLATSGIVALATAAPTDSASLPQAERELVAQLDGAIVRQLAAVKERLAID